MGQRVQGGYSPPASELPGVTTFVTERSEKGLPPNSSRRGRTATRATRFTWY